MARNVHHDEIGGATSQMPFRPVWDERCTVLILGSHPSVKSKENGFYYMHPQNRFWRVMSALFDADFVGADKDEKARLLLVRHVALYDVVERCAIVGSADATIREVRPTDLEALVEGAPIRRVFLNGRTAYDLFVRHFPQYVDKATLLPSTSPANARWRLDDLVAAWQIIKTI